MAAFRSDADGPPTPPPVRRRRRRRLLAGLVGVVATIAVVVGALTMIGDFDAGGRDLPTITAEGDAGAPEGSDAPVAPPELAQLEGVDATFARLLIQVDTSERVMVGFQGELEAVLAAPGGDPAGLLDELRRVAGDAHDELLDIRPALQDRRQDPRVEAVRSSYLRHLEAWAEYLAAVEEDPGVLADEARTAPYDVAINATADEFARALEEQLPDSAARPLVEFAEGILDRGFRSTGGSEV